MLIGRHNFYDDPRPTRAEKAGAAWFQLAQDRVTATATMGRPDICRHCALAVPVAGVCGHCGHRTLEAA